jgi:hypothetical protein
MVSLLIPAWVYNNYAAAWGAYPEPALNYYPDKFNGFTCCDGGLSHAAMQPAHILHSPPDMHFTGKMGDLSFHPLLGMLRTNYFSNNKRDLGKENKKNC